MIANVTFWMLLICLPHQNVQACQVSRLKYQTACRLSYASAGTSLLAILLSPPQTRVSCSCCSLPIIPHPWNEGSLRIIKQFSCVSSIYPNIPEAPVVACRPLFFYFYFTCFLFFPFFSSSCQYTQKCSKHTNSLLNCNVFCLLS